MYLGTPDGIPFGRFANEPQELRSWQILTLPLCQFKNAHRRRAMSILKLVLRTGFEPATFAVKGRCPNR